MVYNSQLSKRGLAERPRAVLQALNMTRLSLLGSVRTEYIGTGGCAASLPRYGTALNRASGLTQCVARQTVPNIVKATITPSGEALKGASKNVKGVCC